MRNVGGGTDVEILQKFLFGDEHIELTERLTEKLSRLEVALEYIEKNFWEHDILKKIRFHFKIPQWEAYQLYKEAKILYSVTEENWLLNRMMKNADLAKTRGKLDIVAKYEIAYLNHLGKKQEKPEDVYKNLLPHTYVFGFFPETTGVELEKNWEDNLLELLHDSPYAIEQIRELTQHAGGNSRKLGGDENSHEPATIVVPID